MLPLFYFPIMIERQVRILSDYISRQNNATWREKQAFNDLVNHCEMLDSNYKDKTLYLERLASWYIDHIFELNQDHIKEISWEFFKHILLDKLAIILNTPSQYNYNSLENNILGLDIQNGNKLKPYGSVSRASELLIKDIIVNNTKDKYEPIKDRL